MGFILPFLTWNFNQRLLPASFAASAYLTSSNDGLLFTSGNSHDLSQLHVYTFQGKYVHIKKRRITIITLSLVAFTEKVLPISLFNIAAVCLTVEGLHRSLGSVNVSPTSNAFNLPLMFIFVSIFIVLLYRFYLYRL